MLAMTDLLSRDMSGVKTPSAHRKSTFNPGETIRPLSIPSIGTWWEKVCQARINVSQDRPLFLVFRTSSRRGRACIEYLESSGACLIISVISNTHREGCLWWTGVPTLKCGRHDCCRCSCIVRALCYCWVVRCRLRCCGNLQSISWACHRLPCKVRGGGTFSASPYLS